MKKCAAAYRQLDLNIKLKCARVIKFGFVSNGVFFMISTAVLGQIQLEL
jgi:hypothetical protein